MCIIIILPNRCLWRAWESSVHHLSQSLSYFLWISRIATILFFFFCKFIYFWLRWVSVAVRRLSLVAASRGYSSLWCAGFSLRWLLLLPSTGSRCAGFSSCVSRAQLLSGMWDLPGPGLKPMSPALAGRFLTTAPPGKSQELPFWYWRHWRHYCDRLKGVQSLWSRNLQVQNTCLTDESGVILCSSTAHVTFNQMEDNPRNLV